MGALDDAADATHDYRQPSPSHGGRAPGRRRRDRGSGGSTGWWARPFSRYEVEGAGIFLTHGVVDGLTTAAAARTLGASGEANPVVQWLLAQGVGFAVLVMVLVAGAVGLAYPWLAAYAEFPRWFGPLLIAVGAVAGVGNLVAVALA